MHFTAEAHHAVTRLQSTGWIIDARWYYSLLAFFLGLVLKDTSPGTTFILASALVTVLCLNLIFYLYLRYASPSALTPERIDLFNMGQVGVDLLFLFIIILYTGGGVESVGHSFFFIPIIVSMILFSFRGAITVALISGTLVFLSVVVHSGILASLLLGNPILLDKEVSLALTEGGIIFLTYLIAGFFGGYIARLMMARDVLLLEQIQKEENHVRRLEELSNEFDKSAKLLVRRDLELSGANEKLTQLDKMKSEIISVVAHQLRTPLSAIKWTLKLLLDEDVGKITPEQKDLLGKGFESNERMIMLINDMLAVDRLESGKLKYNFVPIQFEELVEDMIRSLLPIATQKKIRVEFTAPPKLAPKIKIDPDKMREVLQNLIDNAIKYTPANSVVSVGVIQEGQDIHFWVKDSGIGIPESEKDKIFSRFFRAQNAVRTQTDGSGLGLFIAQSVVKRHGGKIWFESVLNAGTTFHVLLPFSS